MSNALIKLREFLNNINNEDDFEKLLTTHKNDLQAINNEMKIEAVREKDLENISDDLTKLSKESTSKDLGKILIRMVRLIESYEKYPELDEEDKKVLKKIKRPLANLTSKLGDTEEGLVSAAYVYYKEYTKYLKTGLEDLIKNSEMDEKAMKQFAKSIKNAAILATVPGVYLDSLLENEVHSDLKPGLLELQEWESKQQTCLQNLKELAKTCAQVDEEKKDASANVDDIITMLQELGSTEKKMCDMMMEIFEQVGEKFSAPVKNLIAERVGKLKEIQQEVSKRAVKLAVRLKKTKEEKRANK